MLAQIVLTPVESKKLISKAVAQLEVVRHAATEGMVVLHPSSSTYFPHCTFLVRDKHWAQ
jgi:hypothetical protein